MAIKKKKDDGGGGSDWLGTYSDMVTLLLTFFILLFSMSSVDATKFQELIKAFKNTGEETNQIVLTPEGNGDQMGTNKGEGSVSKENTDATKEPLPSEFNELYEYIKEYVEENNMSGSVDVQKGDSNVFVRFKDNLFFKPNSSTLQPGGTDILSFLGDCFKSLDDEILAIRINGHTATVPNSVKTPGFDRTLSTDRANKVLIYLEESKHIAPKKLIAIGYGRNYPVASNDTEDGRSKNRRVEIMVMSNKMKESDADFVQSLLQGEYDADLFKDDITTKKALIPDDVLNNKNSETAQTPVGKSDAESRTQKTEPDSNTDNQNTNIEKNVSPYN